MDTPMNKDYKDIDFVALGVVSDPERSKALNAVRRASHEAAAELRENSEAFAQLPAVFQPIVASLVLVGAEPNHFFMHTSTDATIHLFGTVLSPDKKSWRVFHATAQNAEACDSSVLINNIGAETAVEEGLVFDTIEDAIDALTAVTMSVNIDEGIFSTQTPSPKWIN